MTWALTIGFYIIDIETNVARVLYSLMRLEKKLQSFVIVVKVTQKHYLMYGLDVLGSLSGEENLVV